MANYTEDQAAIYALAYVEGIRVLEDQARQLEQMRVRMMALLGASAAASAFLAGFVLRAKASDLDRVYYGMLALAVLLLFFLVARCVQAQRPRYEWRFNLSPQVIVEGYADHDVPASFAETQRQLSLIAEGNIAHNDANLYRFRKWLDQALILFVIDLVVWVLLAAKVA